MRAIFDVSRWNFSYFRQSYWLQNIFEAIFPEFLHTTAHLFDTKLMSSNFDFDFQKDAQTNLMNIQKWWPQKINECSLSSHHTIAAAAAEEQHTHLSSSRISFPHSNAVLKTDERGERVEQTHLSPHISSNFLSIFFTQFGQQKETSRNHKTVCVRWSSIYRLLYWVLYISTPPQSPK